MVPWWTSRSTAATAVVSSGNTSFHSPKGWFAVIRSERRSQPFRRAGSDEYVAGSYRQRFTLSSGRFAMIDDGLGFQLVPWTPSLEKHLGRHVSGIARGDGGVDWSFGRKRGLSR